MALLNTRVCKLSDNCWHVWFLKKTQENFLKRSSNPVPETVNSSDEARGAEALKAYLSWGKAGN